MDSDDFESNVKVVEDKILNKMTQVCVIRGVASQGPKLVQSDLRSQEAGLSWANLHQT